MTECIRHPKISPSSALRPRPCLDWYRVRCMRLDRSKTFDSERPNPPQQIESQQATEPGLGLKKKTPFPLDGIQTTLNSHVKNFDLQGPVVKTSLMPMQRSYLISFPSNSCSWAQTPTMRRPNPMWTSATWKSWDHCDHGTTSH